MASRAPSFDLEAAFGRALRGKREQRGLSQEELGFRSEVHRTYISELERGLKNPSLTTIAKLAAALGTKASVLVSDAEAALRSGE